MPNYIEIHERLFYKQLVTALNIIIKNTITLQL